MSARNRSTRSSAPQPLTRERIVDAALALVHEERLAGLTTRRLGERLGCEAMSIYHHFPSKQHLLDALVDRAMGSIEVTPVDWPAERRLRTMTYAYRDMAHRYPALYPLLAVHRLNTPTGVSVIERYIDAIHAVVRDVELAARHFRTLGYYLTGACLDETSGYAKGPSAAEPVSDAYITEHCPRLAAAAPYFRPAQWQQTFEVGLETLLSRVEADGAALRARPQRAPQKRKPNFKP